MTLALILLFCVLGSLASVGLAAMILLLPARPTNRLASMLVAYATGTLIAAAFLGMIPHALNELPAARLMPAVVAGLIAFFVLEKLLLWRHCHDKQCAIHATGGTLILVGDAFHNLVDGVVIAASFLTSVELGFAASLAMIAHEIPQELGDFMILIQSGYSRSRAMLFNLLSSSTTLIGGVLAFLFLEAVKSVVPYVLAFSAASFIYIALADLVPGHRRETAPGSTLIQVVLILLGIFTISLLRFTHR